MNYVRAPDSLMYEFKDKGKDGLYMGKSILTVYARKSKKLIDKIDQILASPLWPDEERAELYSQL